MTSRNARPPLPALTLLLMAGLLFSACGAPAVPPNEWSEGWGPLVPHETFPGDCGICHKPDGWEELRADFSFDHKQETGHDLVGAHASAACLRCHNDFGPVEAYTARGCGGCHLDPHRSQLGNQCTQCHNEQNWRPGGLVAEHARTRFPLIGAHAAVACTLCHLRAPAGDYRGASSECAACHREEVARATSPDHAANGWTDRCQRCHLPTDWGGGFTHSFFSLTAGHGGLTCNECHPGNNFGPRAADCFSCHQPDYQTAPNHVASNYSRSCEQCHNASTWKGASIDHSFFPLKAGHANVSCNKCHTSGQTGSIPADCNSCHNADYQLAPSHVASNYSRSCEQCHTTVTWKGAAVDHSFFPLTQGHANLSCSRCHTSGQNASIPSDCNSCHQADYQTAPNHVTSNYSRSCEQCHTTATWKGATVDHSFFPLTGGHANHSCTKCHISGKTGPIPATCVSCHRADYDGAPNHSSFSQSCDQCHNTNRWGDAVFNHTFPLKGRHDVDCSKCHTGGNTTTFTCLDCHAHNKSKMDDKHKKKKNYTYTSSACVQCHPDGKE